ncbi:MAG: hypothetical protein KBS56_03675 [Clostridiales bacterium]|nr:hypothetical protein [Candidatus Crickella equi]
MQLRRVITVLIMVTILVVPFVAFRVLPEIGDPNSAPNSHVTDYYIEHTISECNSPNMVTSIIVDYRAFDTMFETTVMFLSGVAVILILSNKPKKRDDMFRKFNPCTTNTGPSIFKTVNKDVMISIIEPLILIYAIYVLFHGEVSLGGGFQAGALIGMTYLLDVMVVKRKDRDIFNYSLERSVSVAGTGPFIYAVGGILGLIGGGLFMEFEAIPLPIEAPELHSIGILIVEVGVTVGVMCTIITILKAIMDRVSFDDDND